MRLDADIAGVSVTVDGPDRFEPVLSRFRRFPAFSPSRIRVEIREHSEPCALETLPGFREAVARGTGPDYQVELEFSGARVNVRGPWVSGWLDLERREAEAVACSGDPSGAVENFLRVAVAHLLLERGGFLLHACAAVCADGSAIVGFGESGAGKTTLASLAGDRAVISDDLVAISRDASGTLVVIPSPFRPGTAAANPQGHPIRALLSLQKAASLSLTRLTRAAGAATLVASMPFVLDREETASLALALADDAARDPGVSRAAFAPVEGVWAGIEALA